MVPAVVANIAWKRLLVQFIYCYPIAIMEMHDLPFKIDQEIESRSFVKGYRGAWFRCKIKDIARRKDQLCYALEFIDFPGEKVSWTQVYQNSYASRCPPRKKTQVMVEEKQLMLRPKFPAIHSGNQDLDVEVNSDIVFLVNDDWKVGDLVDWLTDGCYWSGKATQILGNGKAKVELLPPPIGEGLSYEVACKDLRPSLNWSLVSGWTVPIQDDDKNGSPCVRLVKPSRLGSFQDKTAHHLDKERNNKHDPMGKCDASNVSTSSLMSSDCLGQGIIEKPMTNDTKSTEKHTLQTNVHLGGSNGKASCSDSVSTSRARDTSPDFAGISIVADKDNEWPSKRMKTELPLNSTQSDTLEASFLDLEELVCRVKWIRGVLEGGTISQNMAKSQWKFVEHRA